MVVTPVGTKKTVFGSVNFNVRAVCSDLWPVNHAKVGAALDGEVVLPHESLWS